MHAYKFRWKEASFKCYQEQKTSEIFGYIRETSVDFEYTSLEMFEKHAFCLTLS
jgi:hypothetical protein